jgi:hypothetical protein
METGEGKGNRKRTVQGKLEGERSRGATAKTAACSDAIQASIAILVTSRFGRDVRALYFYNPRGARCYRN